MELLLRAGPERDGEIHHRLRVRGGFAEPGHVDEEVCDAGDLTGAGREAEAAPSQAGQGGLGHGGREGTGHDRIHRGAAEPEHVRCGIARERGARRDRSAAG